METMRYRKYSYINLLSYFFSYLPLLGSTGFPLANLLQTVHYEMS